MVEEASSSHVSAEYGSLLVHTAQEIYDIGILYN
jgi:hypothetical protein